MSPQRLVKELDRKHPEWEARALAWERMGLLYAGGCAIKREAEQFLVRRPKELSDVYQARVERFSYNNHAGTAVDWYLAAEFEKSPRVQLSEGAVPEFYEKFQKDCDRAGTSFVEKFREVFQMLLVYGQAYVLVDLPPKLQAYANYDEEVRSGQLDPYLCAYDPRQAINWARDAYGNLDWIIFTVRATKSQPFAAAKLVDRWYYFDRQQFAVYEREVAETERSAPRDAVATLVATGSHALASLNRVPVQHVAVPEGLWLMNRAYLPAQDHLNTDNVLGWALAMAALAMPVIKTDADVDITLSEAGFIKLPKESDYAWSEPEGKSFGALAERARCLVEDIFRAFYLIAQARNTNATPAAQSGVSKQQDMAPSKKTLSLFGDLLRQAMQKTMNDVSLARGEELQWDVNGFEFPEEPVDGELATINTALAMSIPSLVAERELYKKAVDTLFSDVNPELRAAMHKEIDTAPAKAERDRAAMEASAASVTGRFAKEIS